jgi:DNA-binding beta-propeller fold protein YncE
MKRTTTILFIIFVLFTVKAYSQVNEPLKLVETILLPGFHDGDFDHFGVDLEGQRLFLSAEENSAVVVIDLRTNKVMHTLREPKTPHSMVYEAQSNKLFVVDSGPPSQVEIFDGTALKPMGTIPMNAHADANVYDAVKHLMYVGTGGKPAHQDYCLVTIIDTVEGKKVGDIKLDYDASEAMALEKSGSRLFVNLPSKNAVAVIDREKRAVIATWSIGREGEDNGPMAIDDANHRLFVVANRPDKVIVLDSDSGKIVASAPCVGQYMADDAVYDPRLKRLYVAGTPFIEVFQQRGANLYQLLGQVPTAFHSNTAILLPQLNRYYVSVNHHGNVEAMVQVYEVAP